LLQVEVEEAEAEAKEDLVTTVVVAEAQTRNPK
jgi:hypothetical protein